MNPEVEIIPLPQSDTQALVRRIVDGHASLPLGMLASSDLRTLTALEKQYHRELYANGVTRQWKTAIALTYAADGNGVRSFGFGDCAVTMNKHFSLTVKQGDKILYDDREAGREKCVPGEWMLELSATIADEQNRIQRVRERQKEVEQIAQIERLKG